jgi:hypothetical protein
MVVTTNYLLEESKTLGHPKSKSRHDEVIDKIKDSSIYNICKPCKWLLLHSDSGYTEEATS